MRMNTIGRMQHKLARVAAMRDAAIRKRERIVSLDESIGVSVTILRIRSGVNSRVKKNLHRPLYSDLSALKGSILVARRAGK